MYVSKYNLLFDVEGRKEKIILNPLFGSMDVVYEEDKEFLEFLERKRAIPKKITRSESDYLITRGYLHNSRQVEDNKIQEIISKDDQNDYSPDFLIYPTFQCNLQCIYCFQDKNPASFSNQFISKEYVDRAFEAIEIIFQERNNRNRPLLYIFGGEPLLKGKRMHRIIHYILQQASQKNIRVGIISNGTNLINYTQILQDFNVEFIQITIDGPPEIHDSRRMYAGGGETFKDIQRGISSIEDSEIKLLLRVNMDSQNVHSLPEFSKYMIKAGWNRDNVEAINIKCLNT